MEHVRYPTTHCAVNDCARIPCSLHTWRAYCRSIQCTPIVLHTTTIAMNKTMTTVPYTWQLHHLNCLTTQQHRASSNRLTKNMTSLEFTV
jgi:hypothetical protein